MVELDRLLAHSSGGLDEGDSEHHECEDQSLVCVCYTWIIPTAS